MKQKAFVFAIFLLLLRSATSCSLEIGTRISTKSNPVDVNSISQNGITVKFDRTYTAGQYISGDYWVVDPGSGVTIKSTSHFSVYGVNLGEHLTKNPRFGKEAYDPRDSTYDASYALSLPAVLHAGDSVVVNTNLTSIKIGSYLYSAIIVTIVDTIQSATKFRPPYARPSRIATSASDPLIFDFSNISPTKWAELPGKPRSLVSGLPTIESTQALIRGPWLDNTGGQNSPSQAHPVNQEEPYGRDYCVDVSNVCTQLCLDYKLADLQLLSAYLIQVGIDIYGVILDGGDFHADGGINSGRKIPVIFAAEMLGSATLASCPQTYNSTWFNDPNHFMFQEDGQTCLYTSTEMPPYTGEGTASDYESWYDDPGTNKVKCRDAGGWLGTFNANGDASKADKAIWHIGGYENYKVTEAWYEHIPITQWQVSQTANAQFKWEGYRACCTSHAWVGEAILMLLWKNSNLIIAWNHDVFFDYIYRWMTQSVAVEITQAEYLCGTSTDPIGFYWPNGTQPAWVKNVYEAYKSSFNYASSYYSP
jgi:hypothetical protein